ncbi:MAG: hypothetical protein J6A46_01610, partial [Clostridia bacterium]|nr:hypothetical protein [Clostridia bacterium]
SKSVNVADYITTYGRDVTVKSSATGVATATLKDGVVTIVGAAKGNATVTISCESLSATISVTVKLQKFSVTVDGTKVGDYEDGSQYELPAYAGALDANHEFLGWIVNGDSANLKKAKDKVTVQANVVITSKVERKAAVIVKAEDAMVLTLGVENASKNVNVADYVTAYGRDITVESSATDIATATLNDGVITIVAVAQGKATVTISCESLRATISVTVNPETVIPEFDNGSIAIDLFTQANGSYAAVVVSNPTQMTFTYALAENNGKASVDANGTVTYNADVVETLILTVNVVATNPYDGLTYDVSFTVEVVVTDTTPQAPVFEDKFLHYDLYTVQDGVAIEGGLKAEDDNFTYVYTVDGKEVVEGHKFAQTATVNVVYTYKGNTAKSGNTSFVVTVTTEDTTPTVINEAIVAESVIDIVNNPTIDLAANVTNTQNVKGYKVNGEAVDGNVFAFVDNGYGEKETEVTFIITVINTKDVELTYTYTVSIRNTDEFCVKNGGFETNDLTGWTVTDGMGSVSDATTYWGELSHQKEGNFFFMGHENKGEGTFVLQSEAFTVHGSGWLTFQMGAAKHFEHQYVEVVKVADDSVIAHVTNAMFADNGGFEGDPNKVSGETLMKYKLDLSSVLGESVYVCVVDTWAGGDFGRILFDNLVSYVPDAESISAEYVDVTNAYFA